MKENADGPKPLATIKEINTIFSNLEILMNFNKELLKKLEARSNIPIQDRLIGDIFLELAPLMKLYTEYINNFDQSSDLVIRLANDRPGFADFIDVSFYFYYFIFILFPSFFY